MPESNANPKGSDFTEGIALSYLPEDGMLVGHVDEEDVLLVRSNADIFALAAHETHYHGRPGTLTKAIGLSAGRRANRRN
jgi:hypothetical protein